MRREALRNALGALLKDPGLSNRELSVKLDMLDSATNRYMKELIERGIVENDRNSEGRTSYVIKNEYREKISVLMERLNGSNRPA
jgi:predicted transcriptional regulator